MIIITITFLDGFVERRREEEDSSSAPAGSSSLRRTATAAQRVLEILSCLFRVYGPIHQART